MGFDAQQFSGPNVLDYGGPLCLQLPGALIVTAFHPRALAHFYHCTYIFAEPRVDVAYWLPV